MTYRQTPSVLGILDPSSDVSLGIRIPGDLDEKDSWVFSQLGYLVELWGA